MRFRVVAISVVLMLTGCTGNGASDSGLGCPSDRANLALEVADEIESRTVGPSVPTTAAGGNWRERLENERSYRVERLRPGMRYVFTPVLFQAAEWAEMYPACFSDEARVRLFALKERAETASPASGDDAYREFDFLEIYEVLAALREP